jgi:uncharacterized phage protein gp47/JayE
MGGICLMAYENMTYEAILSRMIERVSAKYPTLDTREGSLIFNALAPAAIELAIMYTELDNVLSESFVGTASREYLLIACEQMGMDTSSFAANAGIHKAEFDIEVPINSRWNCDLYNYMVTEFIGKNAETNLYEYKMISETTGTGPNNQKGTLIPITDIEATAQHAELVECLIEGENEMSDEDIRTAYFDFVNSVATDGNVGQYGKWCNEFDGIGNAKIFSLWNGPNTVKVSILSVSNGIASEELVGKFQDYLDPGSEGMGDGVAPIGAIVTVSTATPVPIDVSATVKLADGYADANIIDEHLQEYFSEIAYKKNMLSYMSVGAEILKTEGVEFISDLTINNGTSDVILGDEEIPVLNNTTWEVVNS